MKNGIKKNTSFWHSSRKNYVLADECWNYNLSTITDVYGKFKFLNMKPGKYFLRVYYTVINTYYEVVDKEVTYYIDKVVEIKSDNEILKVDLH